VDSEQKTKPDAAHGPIQKQPITSRQNSRVRQLRAAFSGNRRLSSDLVAFEGGHLIAEALRSGVPLDSIYISQSASQKHAEEYALLQARAKTPVYVLSDDAFRSAAGTESPQGIAALIVPQCGTATPAPTGPPLLLALDGLQDPGNLGTLIRSAEAFGATGVITLPGTVSAWNQKSVRASAGSVFRMKVATALVSELTAVAESGIRIFAAVASGGKSASEVDLRQPTMLLIGNEGAGLSEVVMAMAQEHITLAMPGAVESLNAAVAGSLLLYEAARQRGEAEKK
jgi:TrmH family RNA methyltransferase